MLIPFYTRFNPTVQGSVDVLGPQQQERLLKPPIINVWMSSTSVWALFILRILEQWVFHTTPTTTATTSREKQILWLRTSLHSLRKWTRLNMHFHPHSTSTLTKEIIKKGLEFLAVSPYNGCKAGAHIRYREKCLPVTYS